MKIQSILLIVCLSTVSLTVRAQTHLSNQNIKHSQNSVAATVNETKIGSAKFGSLIKFLEQERGEPFSAEARSKLLDDLTTREAISQDASKSGLLKSPESQLRLEWVRFNAIVDIWWADFLKKNPISELDIQSEYESYLKASKEPRNHREFNLSQIVFSSEEDANKAIEELRSGPSFESIARQRSLHKDSADKGGLVGWILPSQLLAPLGDVVINLDKGRNSALPIRTSSGWYLLRVNDVRTFTLPPYDQLREQIRMSLLARKRNQAVAELMAKQKVVKR